MPGYTEFVDSIERLVSYVKFGVNWLASNPMVQVTLIHAFMFSTKIMTWTKIQINRIYENTPILQKISNSIRHLKSSVYNYRIEPDNAVWTSISTINTDDTYEEKYEFSDNTEEQSSVLNFLMKKVKKLSANDSKVDLYILKNDDKYIYRNLSRVTSSDTQRFIYDLSKSRFLSVEYTHNQMEKPIYLDIPRNAYLVGNEILSATFVLRCLKYQASPFVFDMNYILKIMDNNIKQFTMNSGQYCLLGENDYTII